MLNIHRKKEIFELIEYTNISWSDFGQNMLNFSQILVRSTGKISQIVSQILENFSQIVIRSTLY